MENSNNKKLWIAVDERGQECLYVGNTPPCKSDDGTKWEFDGLILQLPKNTIRNLTQKYARTFDDEPILLNRRTTQSVAWKRNNKNLVLTRLLKEKYGVNYYAGFYKELSDAIEELNSKQNN